jgi:hypothetical protein
MKTSIKILFIAMILFLAPAVLTAAAKPSGHEMGVERGHGGSFVEPILIGHGFALNGNEYHILDVNAIKTGEVSPGILRSLLTQNKNPEEIAKEINDMQMETKTRAHLRFAGQAYSLNITSYDNKSLTGDVMTLPQDMTTMADFIPSMVGHISLSISKYEGDMLSTGNLTMNNTDYKVLLTSPMIFRRW